MSALHEQVGAFLDGELPPEQADAFRAHLATCEACQEELSALVQLEAVAGARLDLARAAEADAALTDAARASTALADSERPSTTLADSARASTTPADAARASTALVDPARASTTLADSARASTALTDAARVGAALPTVSTSAAPTEASVTPIRAAPRRASALRTFGPALALLAAGIALFIAFGRRPAQPPTVALALAPSRGLEARVSWAAADAWRPYVPSRAAQAAEPIPSAVLADLEARGEVRALAGAFLLSGNPARARALLTPQALPDAQSDLAAVALGEGRDEEALTLAQAALDVSPAHPQASWNRALALERLGLVLAAAQAFTALGARAEPGWSTEAQARARALEAGWAQDQARSQAALDAAARMVADGTPMPLEVARAMPSWARMNLRYALLTATSAEQVRALLPLARGLDAQLGGSTLVAAVERFATLDFAAKAPRAKVLRALVTDYHRALRAAGSGPVVDPAAVGLGEGTAAAVATLRKKRAWDELVVAIPMGGQLGVAFADYETAVAKAADPWFSLSLEFERARRAIAEGDVLDGEKRLLEVVEAAGQAPWRALKAHEQLAELLLSQQRVVEAEQHALEALRLARGQGEWAVALRLLQPVADAARLRGAAALSTAFLTELSLRRPDDCYARAYLHESAAAAAIKALDLQGARAHFEQVPACEGPLSIVGVAVLADLLRLAPKPSDAARLREAVSALREAEPPPSEAALLQHLEGRAALEAEPARGAALLRAAIATARGLPPPEALPRKVIAYGYGLLRSTAGEEGRFEEFLALTAEELGQPLPPRCALVVEVQDNRVAAAARDAAGAVQGLARRLALRPGGVTPETIATAVAGLARTAAKGCPVLSVYAGYPLHGQAGWLPDDVAWAFSGGGRGGAPSGSTGLVVRDVATPRALGLPRLASWEDVLRPGDRELSGEAATPQRVLEAMVGASYVELHVHAQVNPAEADTAALVLAPDAQGRFSLDARSLRRAQLSQAPVVFLAACRASAVASYLHEPWSLPRAFLAAGASAVIAAPVELPDAQARTFFRAVIARVRAGEHPAAAVRSVRQEQVADAPWVRTVLVFN